MRRVTSDFLQRATSATSDERSLQRAISATSNEQSLQQVTTDFLQRATSATSNERILQRVTSDFTTSNNWISTSNDQRVKSYASFTIQGKSLSN